MRKVEWLHFLTTEHRVHSKSLWVKLDLKGLRIVTSTQVIGGCVMKHEKIVTRVFVAPVDADGNLTDFGVGSGMIRSSKMTQLTASGKRYHFSGETESRSRTVDWQ